MDAGPGDRKQEHVNLYVRACGITGSKASSNIKEASLRSGRITSLKQKPELMRGCLRHFEVFGVTWACESR